MPNQQNPENLHNRRVHAWPILFALLALEGLFILVEMVSIPADPKNALILGFSLRRLAVMFGVLLLAGAFSYFALRSWRDVLWRQKYLDPSNNPWLIPSLSRLSLFVLILCQALLFFTPYLWGENYTLRALYERIQPLLTWLAWIGVQMLVWLIYLCDDVLKSWFSRFIKRIRSDKNIFQRIGLVWLIFLGLWLFVALTRIGITRDPGGWGMPGVPLLEGQIWTVVAGAALLVWIGLTLRRRGKQEGDPVKTKSNHLWIDLALVLVIWVAAWYLWVNQPYEALSYFAPRERPPNFEMYPSSDAGLYDIVAQNILVGNGYLNGKVITRPLYILFLAGLHAAVGQNYDKVVNLQAFFLALFPVMLYLLGRSLNCRLAGLIAAALAIWRELNAIQTIPFVEVSNSKLLMSDLPTALCISLIVYLTATWLYNPDHSQTTEPVRGKNWLPLIIGGALGLTMLIRTQVIILAPFILLLALAVCRRAWRGWLRASALLALGLVLAITPWLWRNWVNTGMILFEQPLQTRYLAQMYSLTPEIKPEPKPGEDDVTYASRLNQEIKDFALHNPGYIASFSLAHFFNNEIDTLLVFPLRHEPIQQLGEVFYVQEAFWWKWDGNLDLGNGFLVFISLSLISIGIGAAWKRQGAAGLAPLAIHIAYSLSNAITRNSGRRWMLPVDWVGYFYYAIGLVQIASWVLSGWGINPLKLLTKPPSRLEEPGIISLRKPAIWKGLLISLAIFLVGSTLPLSEILIPKLYPVQTKTDLVQELITLESVRKSGMDLQVLKAYALQEDVSVVKGRALYPKFYAADDGEPGNGWAIFESRPYPRMGFQLIGSDNRGVILPIQMPPAYFPNASDVIVIGCRGEDHTSAALVAVTGKKDVFYLAGKIGAPECIIPN